MKNDGADMLTVPDAGGYNPASQRLSVNYGNGITGAFTYNNNLQLESLRYQKTGVSDLLNLAYEYVAPNGGNNGQISKIRFYTAPAVEDLTKTEIFQYDAWSRLANSQTQDANNSLPNTWALTWQYDRYGSRLNQSITAGSQSVTAPQLTISTATNRITTAGFGYDNAGNLTNDALHTYAYDAENRIKTVDSTVASYAYDNSGLRMSKFTGGVPTFYVFSDNKVIAEYANNAPPDQPSKEYIYAGSQLLATLAGTTTTYYYRDHLSNRVEADASGNATRKSGHLPFGDNWYEQTVPAGGPLTKLKFTSYERDAESNLDYAVFRYDSSRLGRFMSPDRLAGNLTNPQSMNRYAYVLGDPGNRVDPLGLDDRPIVPGTTVTVDGGSGIPVDLAFFILGGFLMPPRWAPLLDTNSEGFLPEVDGGQPSIKDRLRDILRSHPDCAKLFGGLKNALSLVDKMNLINVDNPFIGPPNGFDPLFFIRDTVSNAPDTIVGYTYHQNVYVSQSNLSIATPDQQNTLFFHELQHSDGKTPAQIDGPNYARNFAEIAKNCGTADQAPQ